MMNRYRNRFDRMGSHGFPHGDFSPYRHTPGRGREASVYCLTSFRG